MSHLTHGQGMLNRRQKYTCIQQIRERKFVIVGLITPNLISWPMFTAYKVCSLNGKLCATLILSPLHSAWTLQFQCRITLEFILLLLDILTERYA